MRRFTVLLLPLILLSPAPRAAAQKPVHPSQRYERLICVVPLTGNGTIDDPIRPLFVPNDRERAAKEASGEPGIMGYQMEITDDGKHAIVEFIARDQRPFQEILARKNNQKDVEVYFRGKEKEKQLEKSLQK